MSVVMPVHDGEPHLGESIDSVLRQTWRDFELVIVENGSSDRSREIARAAAANDPRVRVIEHDTPLGIVGAANVGARAARGELIARQDQDDLSYPRRLEAEVAALDHRPDAVAVGTLYDGIDATGRSVRTRDRWPLVSGSPLPPFPHGSVCLRRMAFEHAGGYREGTYTWEDVDLFLRLRQLGVILVVPEALYSYRFHAGSLTAGGDGLERKGPEQMWRLVDEHRGGRTGHARAIARAARESEGSLLWAGSPLPPSLPEAGRGAGGLALRLRRAWHRRSPATLRRTLALAIRARDLAASPFVRSPTAVDWRLS